MREIRFEITGLKNPIGTLINVFDTLYVNNDFVFNFQRSRGLWVSGHVVRASWIRHRNALTERAWEEAVQGPGLTND